MQFCLALTLILTVDSGPNQPYMDLSSRGGYATAGLQYVCRIGYVHFIGKSKLKTAMGCKQKDVAFFLYFMP